MPDFQPPDPITGPDVARACDELNRQIQEQSDKIDLLEELAQEASRELGAWRRLGEALWQHVRLWPLVGCDTHALECFKALHTLLGKDVADKPVGALERHESKERLAAVIGEIEERWLRRMDPRCRQEFVKWLQDHLLD